MPLEATVICLDGSEFMRNGDYIPTRLEAMRDAANLVCGVKIQMNPENSVGVVAGGLPLGPKVICSCSQDMAALLKACAEMNIGGGKTEFAKALQVSALALKHRRNKNGGQRIVAFVGSPIVDDENKLVKLAKNLKKNNIAVDVIAMGEYEANEAKLNAFMEAVDKSKNSNLVVIPTGVLPSEALMTSPIITGGEDSGDGGMGSGVAAAAAFAEYGGVDPSLDPELAMALRASMEEERARIAAASTSQTEATPAKDQAAELSSSDAILDDEEEMLRQALLMSMSDMGGSSEDAPTEKEVKPVESIEKEQVQEDEDEDEDARNLALALAMSQQEAASEQSAASAPAATPATASSNTTATALPAAAGFLDPNYVNELLEGIEGVNMDDPQIRELLGQFPSGKSEEDDGPDAKKQKKNDKE